MHESADALATAVAGELLTRLTDAQSSGHEPQIALTGGTIADAVHRELARLSAGSEVDWSRVVVWWGDDGSSSPTPDDRNAGQAREAFLDQVGVDPAKVHPMPSTESAANVEEGRRPTPTSCAAFGSGEFDVLMLGIGPDGHIASLFPGFPQLDVDDRIAVPVTGSPKPPRSGSASPSAPSTAPRRSGSWSAARRRPPPWPAPSPKAPTSTTCPAAGVTGTDETIWFLDRPAASTL